jgi:mannose-6-phosphate isomerase-like protein (cupin superfamily)
MATTATRLSDHPIHLGLGATAQIEPQFTGAMEWYAGYSERHGADGAEGRLVTVHEFDSDWDVWEMHPVGREVVLCLAGSITLHQETPEGSKHPVVLEPGEYVVNDPGVWHTADVSGQVSALFITAGEGTQHRPR